MLDWKVCKSSPLLDNAKLFSKVLMPISIPVDCVCEFILIHILASPCYCQTCIFLLIWGEWCCRCGFILSFDDF